MLIARLGLLRLLLTLAFVTGLGSVSRAAGWSDDFKDGNVLDGNPFTWSQNLLGLFPGAYDASSGDYSMSNPGDTSDDSQVTWNDSVVMTNQYIRTQGVVLPDPGDPAITGGNLVIAGRLDTATVSTYLLYMDDGGNLGLQIALGGTPVDIVPSVDLDDGDFNGNGTFDAADYVMWRDGEAPAQEDYDLWRANFGKKALNAKTDVVLELNIVGNQLSGYAWRPGDPKPLVPQITATDTTFTTGKAGLIYNEDDDNTVGVYRYAAAQDTPFLGWYDDFNDGNAEDGNPVTWTYNELGATPGTHTAASGDYSLSNTGSGGDDDNMIPSVNTSFTDSYIRTQTVIVPDEFGVPEGNPGLVGRWDPTTLSGYAMYLDHGGQLALLRVDGGVPSPLDIEDPFEFGSITDVLLEMDIVGDELSVFAWLAGDPKPTTPQLTATDATYASGRAGLLFNEDDDTSAGVFRFAAAQSLPFGDEFGAGSGSGSGLSAVPEPTGLLLLVLAAIGASLLGGRRRAN